MGGGKGENVISQGKANILRFDRIARMRRNGQEEEIFYWMNRIDRMF
jgi:hypothetical protein